MAKGSVQTSPVLAQAIKRKADFERRHNSQVDLSGGGGAVNEVISGHMSGSSMVLVKQDNAQVIIPNVEELDAFDHFIAGSANTNVTEVEALSDWANV